MRHFPSADIGMFGRRQRHMRGHRIPVSILSGSAVREPGTVVVGDTFGADDVAPLAGGCACCTVRVELQAALRRLMTERAQGRSFTRVVVETDQDIAPILRTFITERALGAEFYVDDAPTLLADGTNNFMLTEGKPLSWDVFSRFMATLMALRGPDLVRVSGLLNIANCRGPVGVEFMGHLAHQPVELQNWPRDERRSRLKFVTRGVEATAVRGMFDAVRALS
jgi:G3E family GTPase